MIMNSTGRAALAAALAAAVLCPLTARAASPSVEAACSDDYFRFCSQHDPDSKGVRSCMKANQRRLSKACVTALVESGEAGAPKRKVARSGR
jgi:hypothetical protein